MTSNEKTQNLSEIERLLQQNVGQEILIKLKNNISVKGNLGIFDQHLNLTLMSGEVIFGGKIEIFENLLVRGGDVLLISLLESHHPKN